MLRLYDAVWIAGLVATSIAIGLAGIGEGAAWLILVGALILPACVGGAGSIIAPRLAWLVLGGGWALGLALAVTIAGPGWPFVLPALGVGLVSTHHALTGIDQLSPAGVWRSVLRAGGLCLAGVVAGVVTGILVRVFVESWTGPGGVGAGLFGVWIAAGLVFGLSGVRAAVGWLKRWNALTQRVSHQALMLDQSSSVHLWLNPAGRVEAAFGPVATTFGVPPSTLTGTLLVDLVDEPARERVAAVLGGNPAVGANPFPRANEPLGTELRGTELLDNEDPLGVPVAVRAPVVVRATVLGRPVSVSCAALDGGQAVVTITTALWERAELERLRAANHGAKRQAAERAGFFAQLNHELRTPLNAILGFADTMREQVFGPIAPQYAGYVEDIHNSATHLVDLVGNVIESSKLEAGAYQLDISCFDAHEAVAAAMTMLKVLAEQKDISLVDVSPASDVPLMVEADPRALRQIVINLIANAVKFTPQGGRIAVSMASADGRLVLSVADNGAGMSAEDLARLGEPYVQTAAGRSNPQAGSGLGLSIVRRLAELHGGVLTTKSTLGEGSEIGIVAPVMASLQGHKTAVQRGA